MFYLDPHGLGAGINDEYEELDWYDAAWLDELDDSGPGCPHCGALDSVDLMAPGEAVFQCMDCGEFFA
jgi:hypothetical protein